jgi:hypothetical protein
MYSMRHSEPKSAPAQSRSAGREIRISRDYRDREVRSKSRRASHKLLNLSTLQRR